MKISNKKLNYYVSMAAMLVASFPTTANFSGSVTTVLRLLYLLGFAWALIIFLGLKYYRLKRLYPVLIMLPWFVLCSYFNDGSSTIKCGFMCIRMFNTIILTQNLINNNCKKTIKQIGNIWSIYMIIQLISYLTGFMGMTSSQNTAELDNFFFGIRVEINEYIIYTIVFGVFAAIIGGVKEKILAILAAASAVYFAVGEWVSTSVSGILIFGFMILLQFLIKRNRKWRYLVVVILVASVAFPYLMDNQFVSWYVTDVVGEDITFNGRTLLWTQAIGQIKGWQILFGKGFEPISDLWIIGKYAFVVNHPHNNYIQFYYWYGVVGVVMYFNMFARLIKRVNNIIHANIRTVFIAAMIANMIMAIFSRNYWYMTAQIFYVYGVNMNIIDKAVEEIRCN